MQTFTPEFHKAKSIQKSNPEVMKNENKTTERAQIPQVMTTVKTLIIGDSTVKHIKIDSSNTKIYCFPNAVICDITEKISSIISDHKSVNKIIIHAGANDTRNHESVLLKLSQPQS